MTFPLPQGPAPASLANARAQDAHSTVGPMSAGGSGDDHATMVGGGDPVSLSSSSLGELPEIGNVMAGRYGIEKVLGQGGMGAVYLATDQQRNTKVALKVMLPGAAGDQALLRFQREAEALAKVDDHVGIVRIRDYGVVAGLPYAALDLIEGGDLHDRVKEEGALPVEEAVRLTIEVARAIHHCHERSILHRDLKPANIMVRAADGAPFVTDFGLAYDAEDEGERLTQTGQVMGTPAYMPPEQAEGDKEQMNARSDVYSLGAILYELLAGQAPFRGEGMSIIKKVLLDEPETIRSRRAEVPLNLESIQQKAMAKDPEMRYPSAAELADDLERHQRGEPVLARPPTRKERMRWRRKQGDKRAIAQMIAVRVLIPLALVVGLAQGVLLGRPLERYQVSSALGSQVPTVLEGLIAYPNTPAASQLQAEANDLARNLATIHGLEVVDGAPPAKTLRRIVWGDHFPADAVQAALLAYALRVEIASGRRPSFPSEGDADVHGTAVDLLRELGFGRGPKLDGEPPQIPKESPDEETTRIAVAVQEIEDRVRTHETGGWSRDKERWDAEDLAEGLSLDLNRFGGSESWRAAIRSRHRAAKATAAQARLVGLADPNTVRTHDIYRIYNTCLEHLGKDPQVDLSLLDAPLAILAQFALSAMGRSGSSAIERFEARPEVIYILNWDRGQELAIQAAEKPFNAQYLLRDHITKGKRVSVTVLLLAFRLGTRFIPAIQAEPAAYARDIQKFIERRRSRKRRAPAEAYYLWGDARYAAAKRTTVDRDNPEIILRLVGVYSSALGPDALPFDPAPYKPDLVIETPSNRLLHKPMRHVECRVLTLMTDYENYLVVKSEATARPFRDRRRALIARSLKWYLAHGHEIGTATLSQGIFWLSKKLYGIRAECEPADYEPMLADLVVALDSAISRVLLAARQIGGKEEREKIELSALDEGIGPEQLERHIANLAESFGVAIQATDYPRALAKTQEIHKAYREALGGDSFRLHEAEVRLTLGNANPGKGTVHLDKLSDAKAAVERYVAFLVALEGKSSQVEDLPVRLDGARAWHAQVLVLGKDLAGAQRIEKEALEAKLETPHPNWIRVRGLLREAESAEGQ
ncbi:MAG: serine/threonine protein kinase [Planctomycetes bacterium]|nr:serine/threonine protein kinase [Planctomycetota bacterium]